MALSIIESKCLLVLKRLLKFCNLKFFFFFQAEDGIRDLYVTGVQTCALPIYAPGGDAPDPAARAAAPGGSRRTGNRARSMNRGSAPRSSPDARSRRRARDRA